MSIATKMDINIISFRTMKHHIFIVTVLTLLFLGCTNTEDKHKHEAGGLEPLAYTLYSDKSELFVEFKPLIVGETSKFAAHFTTLGKNFLPLTEAKVTVSLIIGENGIRNSAEKPSSPGIFRLALTPKKVGTGKLVFHIKGKNYSDKISIENVRIYPNQKAAIENPIENSIGEEISYLKEQAWKIEFATTKVKKQNFSEIIKTTGKILSAQGDEVVLTAKNSGIITFGNNKKLIGSAINSGETLLTISRKGLLENNLDTRYSLAKATYEKAEKDFQRARELVKDNIISQKEFNERQLKYKNAKTTYTNIANSYTSGGQKVKSPIKEGRKSREHNLKNLKNNEFSLPSFTPILKSREINVGDL